MADVKIDPSWKAHLQAEFSKPYFEQLISFVKTEYQTTTIFPPGPQIFRAFELCPFDQTKVVILGQDPYHTPGKANGLAFAVNEDESLPPSLKNIYKEIKTDLGYEPKQTGDLERWAKQGVLLLNATLTVRAGQAGSHQKKGWEEFTDAAIKALSDQKEHLVFILWGAYAIKKGEIIDRQKHLVLTSAHPSPFSADKGFFGNRHFSLANGYLKGKGESEVEW
jgi:uracil-DNA glycosylase